MRELRTENAKDGPVDEPNRAARNEAIFREVNERIEELARPWSDEMEVFCECADPACTDTMSVSVEKYEAVRAHPTWFFVLPGHEETAVEEVVERGDGILIVSKRGEAGEMAAELDPRSHH